MTARKLAALLANRATKDWRTDSRANRIQIFVASDPFGGRDEIGSAVHSGDGSDVGDLLPGMEPAVFR